jgi:hypothetical protein
MVDEGRDGVSVKQDEEKEFSGPDVLHIHDNPYREVRPFRLVAQARHAL